MFKAFGGFGLFRLRFIFVASFLLIAGSAFANSDKPISITFINPGSSTGFWGAVSATMQAAANDLNIELEIIHTNRDRLAMLAASKEVSARNGKPDYVVLVNELEQGPTMLRQMAAARIKTFFLLNKLSEEQITEFRASNDNERSIAGSIIPDNEIAGFEMGQSLIRGVEERLGSNAQVEILAILGDSVTAAALQREAGLKRAVSENPNARIVRSFPVLWSREEAYNRTAFALKVLKVNAIWAANDDLAFGAQDAARENGYQPGADMLFAGLNWSRQGLDAVRDGTMTMTHGGHFFAGAWSMVLLKDLHAGASEIADREFPMSPVTSENVDLFLDRLGSGDWEMIDFSQFAKSISGKRDYDFSANAILAAASSSK